MNPIHPIRKQVDFKKINTGLSWSRFFAQAMKDIRLYFYCACCLSFFRFILIMTFINRKGPETGWVDILTAMSNGFRFDSRISFYVILPTLLLGIIGGFFPLDKVIDKTRYGIAITFTTLTLFVCGATVPYFKEYDDQFNQWLLGLIFDDVHAIIKTIWTQVPVLTLLVTILLLAVGAAFLLKRMLRYPSRLADVFKQWPLTGKVFLTLCLIGLLVTAGRGSVGRRPVQLKDAAVTRDDFLNKTVLTPYDALRYLWGDYKTSISIQGFLTYLPDGDIRSAVKSYFNDPRNFDDLDTYMTHTVQSANNVPPKHIFLIVMEGYDSWPMLDQYQSLQLCTQLNALAEKGIWIKRFLPAHVGTTPALTSIMTGLHDANTRTNYQPSSRTPYPSSIAPIFRALGYKTRFFYGGYLSWQHIGDFARNQGFEEVYGAPHMGQWVHANEWGVDDDVLFDFIKKTVSNDQPSFSMIMTTSYHPPYDIDVYGLGFPTKAIPPDLAGRYDGGINLKIFGHLWYADRALGDFIRKMDLSLENPLFAITGDHWSRKFLNNHPSLYEKSSVPLVLYGPAVLTGKHAATDVVGCHTDIGPTLIELCAPEGFIYHSIGKNLLSDTPPPAAFGAENIIMGPDFIMNKYNPKNLAALPGYPLDTPNTDKMIRMANQYYAIGWWRIMRGAALP
jgi:phosphoglycerol transferase MdoB-like AlkP superfamily enzyme